MRPSEGRAKSEGATKLVEVEHRGRHGSRGGNRSRGGKPRGWERDSWRKRVALVEGRWRVEGRRGRSEKI